MSRRAVSPVLSTMLLVAMAVSAGVALFQWGLGYMEANMSHASGQLQDHREASGSLILIETVDFEQPSRIHIVVRNVGSRPAVLGAVYINGEWVRLDPKSGSETYPAGQGAYWYPYARTTAPPETRSPGRLRLRKGLLQLEALSTPLHQDHHRERNIRRRLCLLSRLTPSLSFLELKCSGS